MDLIYPALELGLLYSFAVFGVLLTFRILRFPDLTVDGTFVTGAAATALAIRSGVPGLVAVFLGFAAGSAAGCITAFLHTHFRIDKILSSILTLGMLYTINLRLMDGPNISLLNESQIIPWLNAPLNHPVTIAYLAIIIIGAKFFIDWFLQTELGLFLRATGDNEHTVASLGFNPNVAKWIGVGLGNGCVGLSGGFIAQYQGFVDVNMGIGIIILGIAAYMIGQSLLRKESVPMLTWAVILGAIVYELIVNSALRLGLPATDLKFITASIVVIALVIGNQRIKQYGRRIARN